MHKIALFFPKPPLFTVYDLKRKNTSKFKTSKYKKVFRTTMGCAFIERETG